jgi:chaperone BCS1
MFDNTTGVKIYGWAAKDWMYVTKTPHRSLDSVILPDSTLELLKRSLDKFRNSEQWYLDHNIPYQIGIMLHGSPGTGKTSLVKVIASYMKSSVCVLAASQLYALKDSVKVLPTETILVIEDIDTNPITHQRKSKTPTLELAEPSGGASGGDPISPDSPNVSMVGRYLESSDKEDEVESMVKQSAAAYLSDVLNSLDGLFSIHGRILIITTNHPDELDDALVRPGRIDVKIEVGYAKDETFVKFIKKMYDVDYRFPEGCHVKEGVTFAILQNEKIRDVPYESVIEKFVVRYSEPRRGDNG